MSWSEVLLLNYELWSCSAAAQTHLTFICVSCVSLCLAHKSLPVQTDTARGLMYHCHLNRTTWLQIMHNYDKWLMMVLWSVNIICIHICLITAMESKAFRCQAAGTSLRVTRGVICLGEDVPMNKYVVWVCLQPTEIHYQWLLFWSNKHARAASAWYVAFAF